MIPQFLPGYAFTQALRHYSRLHRTRKGQTKITYLEMLYIHAIGCHLKTTSLTTFRPKYLSDNHLISYSTITQCLMNMVKKQLLLEDYHQDKNQKRRKTGYSLTAKGWHLFQNIDDLANRYLRVYEASNQNKFRVDEDKLSKGKRTTF